MMTMRPLFALLAVLVLPPLLGSCAGPTGSGVRWVQVQNDPATYYPAGFSPAPGEPMPKGNWVSDEAGRSRYFVPAAGAGGRSASQLQADALSRVAPGSLPPAPNRGRVSVGMGVGVGSWGGGSGTRGGIGIGTW